MRRAISVVLLLSMAFTVYGCGWTSAQKGAVTGAAVGGAAGAAIAVSRRGCATAMPDRAEIDEMMSSRGMDDG